MLLHLYPRKALTAYTTNTCSLSFTTHNLDIKLQSCAFTKVAPIVLQLRTTIILPGAIVISHLHNLSDDSLRSCHVSAAQSFSITSNFATSCIQKKICNSVLSITLFFEQPNYSQPIFCTCSLIFFFNYKSCDFLCSDTSA